MQRPPTANNRRQQQQRRQDHDTCDAKGANSELKHIMRYIRVCHKRKYKEDGYGTDDRVEKMECSDRRDEFHEEHRWKHLNPIDILHSQGIEPNPGPDTGNITTGGRWVERTPEKVLNEQGIEPQPGLGSHETDSDRNGDVVYRSASLQMQTSSFSKKTHPTRGTGAPSEKITA